MLERADWTRDLHFQTATTIDTLDYSGTGLNEGSKAVIAACGPKRRTLGTEFRAEVRLPQGFGGPRAVMPGVLALQAPVFRDAASAALEIGELAEALESAPEFSDLGAWPLVVLTDDSRFCAATLNNFLWTAFTRSNPSHDLHGVRTEHKHWGCRGALILDARLKPHHAPPLVEDPAVTRRVDALAAAGGPLHGIL